MRYVTVCLLLLLFTTGQAFSLTLQEATDTALQNHQQIVQSRANLDLAEAQRSIAGSTFLPTISLDYSYLERNEDPFLLGEQSATLKLGGTINLFNGLRDYHNYRAASQRAEGARYRLRGSRADVALAAKQAFIEALRANRSVATAVEGVQLLERQLRDARLKFEYGLIARNELLRVEVELSSARQDLLNAKGQQRIARRQLERTIGRQIAENETLVELTTECRYLFDAVQIDSYRQQLLENRSELLYLRNELQAAELEQRASRGGYLPRINLAASHEQYDDELSLPGNEIEDDLLSLNASWTLFDGFAREKKLAAANARVRALDAAVNDLEANLLLQLETALQNARISAGRQQEAAVGVTSAEENYRVTENRFQQQQATTVDLLDAQYLLTRSRNLEINARYDRYLSQAQLERVLEIDLSEQP